MSKVVGVLESVKQFGKMYSIKVDGVMYGTGSVEPKAGVGDTVAFVVTENGKYKNADMKTFSVEAGAPVRAPAASGGNSYNDRQPVIARQSALNSAIAFVQMIVDAGALPGTTAKSTPDEKYGIAEALVNEKAEEFYECSTDGRAPGSTPTPTKGGTATPAARAASDGNWE